MIALGTVGELIQQVGEEDRLVLNVGEQRLPDGLLQKLQTVEGVTRALYNEPTAATEAGKTAEAGKITIYAKRGRKALPHVIQYVNESGMEIMSVGVREPDLEAVFLQMTGRALRD